MAIIHCFRCDVNVDLDYETDGVWTVDNDYICEQCVDILGAEAEGNDDTV